MKQLRITILLTVLMSMFGAKALAYDIEVANKDGVTIYYNWINNNTELAVTRYGYCYSGDVVIPESVAYEGKTYSVTSIGREAFSKCSDLTSVTIPNSVTSIDVNAFEGCSGLTSVSIPNCLTSIGNGAFYNCSNLTSLTIPNSVTSIGSSAFYNTAWFNNQPDGLVYVGKLVYTYKGEMPANTTIALEDGLLGIAGSAFFGCSGLTSVTIPNSVTSIGDGAFARCSNLTSVTIPNSVTSIGKSAFCACSSLTSINIPNSVTSILYYTFSQCSSLTSVNIPNSVTSIGENAFSRCTSLTSVTIPNSVTKIEFEAFAACSGLTSLTIGNSVTYIGPSAFLGCSGLTSIGVEEGNSTYDSRDNCNAIIETGTNTLLLGCQNTIIPNNVTSIGEWAFVNRFGLTSIIIPNSVTSIGDWAFYGCSGLTTITIPNSVTSIGRQTFYKCTGLTSITIPNSVTSIDGYAFMGCSGLNYIRVEEGNSTYDSRDNCNAIIETGTNKLLLGCQNTIIPNSVTSIEQAAFNGADIPVVVSLIENPFEITGMTSDKDHRTFTENTFNNATLYVPVGTIEKYRATEGWKDFMNMEEGYPIYTLTYMVDGEVYKTYELLKGTAIVPEPEPTKDGYEFSGWSTIPETMPEEDFTITGSFTSLDSYDVITLKDTGKGTWCSDYDLDFTDVEGIKAYTATGYDDVDKTIWLTRVFKVPAGTGIMVKGDPGEHKIPHAKVKSVYANFFKGVTGSSVTINETDGDSSNYYMAGGQFKKVNGSTTISPNRAYLQLPTLVFAGTRTIEVVYGDEEDYKTGIRSAEITSDQEPAIYYNLHGQRVNNPRKGLYIINGKKYVIK